MALEVGRVAAAHAGAGARLRADPGVRRRSLSVRRRAGAGRCRPAPRRAERHRRHGSLRLSPARRTSSPSRPSGSRARCGSPRACCAASASFFFISFLFAYFYLRSLDTNNDWKIGRGEPSRDSGSRSSALLVLSAVVCGWRATRPADALRRGDRRAGHGARWRSCSSSSSTRRSASAPASGGVCQRVHRLDGHVRRVRDRDACTGSRPRSRACGAAPAGRASPVRVARGCPPTRSSCCGRGSRRARSSGPSTSAIGVLGVRDPLPGLSGGPAAPHWSVDPSLVYVVLAAALYWLGGRGRPPGSARAPAAACVRRRAC